MPPGAAKPDRNYNLRMSVPLYEVLRRHAFERNVSMNKLITDIMRVWAHAATDPTDPFFSPAHLGVRLPDLPEPTYPGYLESLIFTIARADHANDTH